MVITISRQYGAGGSDVARRVASALGWSVVDNELVEQVAQRAGIPMAEVAERDERAPGFVERLTRTLAAATPELFPPPEGTVADLDEATLVRITESVVGDMAARGRVVLVGRAAPAVLGQQEEALHVKLVAPRPFRIHAASQRLGMDPAEVVKIVDDTDAMRASRELTSIARLSRTDFADYPANTGQFRLGPFSLAFSPLVSVSSLPFVVRD